MSAFGCTCSHEHINHGLGPCIRPGCHCEHGWHDPAPPPAPVAGPSAAAPDYVVTSFRMELVDAMGRRLVWAATDGGLGSHTLPWTVYHQDDLTRWYPVRLTGAASFEDALRIARVFVEALKVQL